MLPDLRVRAADARERMDEPDADPRMLERTYRLFAAVNRLVSRPGMLYRRHIHPRARRGPVRILDVGAGGGDLCRELAARLRRDGLDAEITALDPDERATSWARAHDAGASVRYRTATTSALVGEGERFDVVLSNHVLHHLTAVQLRALLDDSSALIGTAGTAVHADIARSRRAYLLFAAATRPFADTVLSESFIRADGLTSIRRSFTVAELRALVPDGWSVRAGFPSRLEVHRGPYDARP